jgi:hypothetical protein
MPRVFLGLLGAVLAFVSASSGRAAVPVPPDQVAYSGVLVDGGGAPLAGPVDLAARIYDAASGGTLVFKQSFTGVALEDGHFTLNLGPTGVTTDSPANPLTTSLRTALTGDLAAAAGRFVEITMDADPPLARVALVLVPYAMRADHATTSDVATQALDTQAVDGLDGVALLELFEHYDEDPGIGLASTDPREGTADPDGDGEANFVDPDNDNDTHTDVTELDQGWDPNLKTPWTGSVVPNFGLGSQQTPVTVTGAGFLPGLTATFGSQFFTPTVTPTSFSLTVGPQPAGAVSLVVTNPNGETSTQTSAFTFTGVTTTTLPSAPIPLYNNYVLTAATQIVARGEQLLVTGLVATGSNRNRYSMDTVVDGTVAFDFGAVIVGTTPNPVSWNSSRVPHLLRGWASTDQVQLVPGSGNVFLSYNAIPIESPGVDPILQSPSLTFDASDRPGGGYIRNVGGVLTAVAFHDRNLNFNFAGTNEVVVIEPVTGATTSFGEAAFDPSGRLAYVYYDSGAGLVRAAWDRSGDGDFNDTPGGTPELVTVAATPTPFCFGMTFDTAGRLAVLLSAGDNPTLRRDLTGDGDFDDAGESPVVGGIGAGFSFACDVGPAATENRVFVVHNAAANANNALPRLLLDLNDDGDYVDAGESEDLLSTPVNGPFAVTKSASGGVRLLTGSGVVVGPVR